jgi:ATP-dependent Zn protease
MTDPTPQPVINYASPGATPPPPPPRKAGMTLFGWVLFIGLAVMLFFILQSKNKASTGVALTELTTQLRDGNVSEVVVDADTLVARLIKPITIGRSATPAVVIRTDVPTGSSQSWVFMQWLLEHANGADVRVENNANLLVNLLVPLIPWLLIFAFLWYFVFRQLRRNSGQPPKPMAVYLVNPETK